MSVTGKKHIFSSMEKKTFMDILKRYSNIVESKETDGATLRAKNEAWHSITRVYNSSPHSKSEVTNKQLRRLWMNLKQRHKEDQTKKHKESHPSPTPVRQQQQVESPIPDDEYRERQFRVDQLHELEVLVMRERLKEAQAKVREAEARARIAEAKAELAEQELAQKLTNLASAVPDCED